MSFPYTRETAAMMRPAWKWSALSGESPSASALTRQCELLFLLRVRLNWRHFFKPFSKTWNDKGNDQTAFHDLRVSASRPVSIRIAFSRIAFLIWHRPD